MSLILDVLYYIFTFPRLIFSFVGYNPQIPFLIASKSELDQLEFAGQSDSITSQISSIFAEEEDSWLDSLVPSVSCYFPAVLKFGAVKYDMTLISLLVISAFVAVLTSSFVLLIIALYPTTFYSLIPKRARPSPNHPAQDSWDVTTAKDQSAFMRKIFESSRLLNVEHSKTIRSEVARTEELTIHRSQCSTYPEFEIQANALESLLQIMNIPYNVLKSDKLNVPVISLDGCVNIGYDEALTFIELMFPMEFSQISIPAECQVQGHFIKMHVFHHIPRILHHERFDSSSLHSTTMASFAERSTNSDPKVWENLLTSVDILATVLGDKLNYLEDRLTEIDVVVFAAIDQILRYCPKEQNATYLLQEFPNLCSWFARTTEEILSCKNSCCSNSSESSSPTSSDISRNSSRRSRTKLNDSETGKSNGPLDVKTLVSSSGDHNSSNNDVEMLKSYIDSGSYNFGTAEMKNVVESECSSVYNQELEDDLDEMPEFDCFSDQKPVMNSSIPVQSVQ